MRKIIHVDMDCFYAAVEVKKNPELRGKPLGIGGPADSRSVLCTASYEARKFGVRAAMPSSQAVRLCPQLILIPPDFAAYKRESAAVRKIFERFTKIIQPLSLDEAYLDVTDVKEFSGSATLIAYEIRKMIFQELSLTASAGIAPNKFLAKIASDWNKPNGQFVIRPNEVDDFVTKLNIEKIYGVGKVTARRMHDLGLMTCADIQKHSIEQLNRWFGKRGADLYHLARGRDDRPVRTDIELKSISVEETYNKDLKNLDECYRKLPELYSDWVRRVERNQAQNNIKNISVKVRYHDFRISTREVTLKKFPDLDDFKKLFHELWEKRPDPIRLLGVGCHLKRETVTAEKKLLEPLVNSDQLNFAI